MTKVLVLCLGKYSMRWRANSAVIVVSPESVRRKISFESQKRALRNKVAHSRMSENNRNRQFFSATDERIFKVDN